MTINPCHPALGALLLLCSLQAAASDKLWGFEYPVYQVEHFLQPDWPSAATVGSEVDYGAAVALDGDWMLVGAPGRLDSAGLKRGAVFLYRRGASGWQQTQRIHFGTGGAAECGAALALRGDWAAIGCPEHSSEGLAARGRVLLYRLDRTAGQLLDPEILLGQAADDRCGTDLALTGTGLATQTWMAIGCPGRVTAPGAAAGAVELRRYTLSGMPPLPVWSAWGEVSAAAGHAPSLQGAEFGHRLALEQIGGSTGLVRLLVGMPWAVNTVTGAGLAFVYERPLTSGNWSLQKRLQPSTGPQASAQFGSAVALSGQRLVVGAVQASIASGAEGTGVVFPFVQAPAIGGGLDWIAGTRIGTNARWVAISSGEGFSADLAFSGNELWVSQPYLHENRTRPYVQRFQFVSGQGFVRRQAFFLEADLEQAPPGSQLGLALAIDPVGQKVILGAPRARTVGDEQAERPWGRVLTLGATDQLFRDRFAQRRASPGVLFKDCRDCPIMVGIKSGSFTMGALVDDPDAGPRELPRRQIQVPEFVLGQTEVTFAQWDACVAAGGCDYSPSDNGLGRADRPVVNVSWNDVQQYLQWLSATTGYSYRLPSEAEWEYAARYAALGRYPGGDCLSLVEANFDDFVAAAGCPTAKLSRGQPVAVGSFPPNPLGLHDMLGNVHEWVADCWNENYQGAPNNAQPWLSGDCQSAPIRGGEYGSGPVSMRLTARDWDPRTVRARVVGFRVARAVGP